MNNNMKKLISKFTVVSMTVSMLSGIGTVSAAENSYLYRFDASEITDFTSDQTPNYGFSYDTTQIWGPALESNQNAVYTPGIRFTTRKSDGGDYDLFKMTFANDTVNNPDSAVFTDSKYVLELEYSTVYNSDGYMSLDFIGKNAQGSEVEFANARITFNRSADTGTFVFVDSAGVALSEESTFDMNNTAINSGKIGVPSSLQYLKAEFDFAKSTFNAWHTVRKNCEDAYNEVQASDDNKIVSNQPLNASGIKELTGFSGSVTSNAATNGYRINTITISESASSETEPTEQPTQKPTENPVAPDGSVLIDEEDFSGKSVSSNTLPGWEFYDMRNEVDSLSNVTLSMQSNALKLTKVIVAEETDYSARWRSMYRFREMIAEDEYTKTYSTNLTGKYKIETVARSTIQSGSQFQQINPAIGATGSIPDMVYNMCIDSTGVYEYISSSEKPKLHSGSLLNSDVTYTYEIDTDKGECITKVNGGEGYVKTFTPGTPLQGIMYILKSKAKANDYMTVKNIKLYRVGEDDAGNEAVSAAEQLTIDMLTNNPDEVASSLNSLPDEIDGAVVSWSSSDKAVISDNGILLDRPLEGSAEVTMTAAISKGDDTVFKDFTLKVKKIDTTDFELIQDVDFSDENQISITNNGGSVKTTDGQLILKRTSASQTPTAKIYPVINGKSRIKATGLWTWESEVEMLDGKYQKAEIVLYDSNGQRITSFYTTCKSGGAVVACVGRETQTGAAVHKELGTGSKGAMKIRMKVVFDTDTQRMSLYAALNDAEEYTTVYENKFTREESSELEYIQVTANSDNTNGDASLFGSIKINDMKLYTVKSNLIPLAVNNMKYYSSVEALGGYIKDDIELKTEAYDGMTVSWTSSEPTVLSNDGRLNTEAFTVDTPVSLTFRIELADTEYFEEKTFDLIALWIDKSNIAIDKTADTGKIVAMTGHSPQKAVDGSVSTYWQTMRFADMPVLTIDLERDEVLNRVVLYEAPMMDAYAIKGYTIEYSRDNSSWKTLAAGTTLGEAGKTIAANKVIARYLRFKVTEKIDDYCVGLKEFMVYGPKSNKDKAEADIILALDNIGNLKNVSQNKSLPALGQYGSKLTYKSTIPSNFSDSGTVVQGTEVKTGELTVTAENGGETADKTVAVSVAKKPSGSQSGGNSGGGGGGGSSSSSVANTIPARPSSSANTSVSQPAGGTFGDVNASFWAYTYIEALAAKGVVSGDEKKNFRPGDNVSRQEFVKMIIIALGADVSDAENDSFGDVKKSDWSYKYIAKAVEMGIVNGVSDGLFDKESPISRQDMAVMCMRALKSLGKYKEPTGKLGFTDAQNISDYADEAILSMNESGIISGYDDNSFRPGNNATRAESAKIIYMLIK